MENVIITRLLNAPVEQVFKAWTTKASLEKWYAPKGCTIKYPSFNFKENGNYHSCLVTPDGKNCWCIGNFIEIIENKKISFTMAVSNAEGKRIQPSEAGMDPDWPQETLVTVTFTPQGNKTILELKQTVSETLAKHTGAYHGWLLMFDLLDELLVDEKIIS